MKILLFFLISGQLFLSTAFAQETPKKHVVEGLDNYYSLSLKYDVSIDDLKNANPDIIIPKPGDIIIIPVKQGHTETGWMGECERPASKQRKLFRIALMIPLSLEQVADSAWKASLDPGRINEMAPFRFIQFYHGFMLAVDSLRRQGLNVEVNVFDIDSQQNKVFEALNNPKLKQMDMIFGPFYKNNFSQVASFALEHEIPIINPLSPRTDIIENNPFVFKLVPTAESQPEKVAALCKREFRDHNIMIYTANKFQNADLVSSLKKAIEAIDPSGIRKVAVVDYQSDSTQGFYDHASLTRPNLVVIFAESEVLPAALLSKLSADQQEYRISVIGLPEWEKFGNIESAYLITLNTHIFSASYPDYGSHAMNGFISRYRSEYLDEPQYYAFSGFDAAYFFLAALLYYGNDFYACLNEMHTPLIQNQFHFEQNPGGGYNNVNWNVLEYLGYSLIKKTL